MRHVTEDGIDLIKRFEGFSPTIYICPAGHPTIGYGHVILEDEKERFSAGIDQEEGEDLLRRDAQLAERAVLRLINVPLTDGQFDSLVSFTFNLGGGALQRSTLRRKLNRQEFEAAAGEFRRWVWAGGRKLKGLIKRREAEAALFRDNVRAVETENPAAA
jgi:GH24 family phage-related lysozyme (muramidase)